MTGFPSFPDFYRAVHGRHPFPWQERLARQVVEQGWPTAIGVPTGLGKTAAIDVAVWSMAGEADREPAERRLPRRIWYVVDRRLLVDVASDHVQRLAGMLHHAADPVLARVAEALRALRGVGADRPPLFVSRLRGGATLGLRVSDPAQPAVMCTTVPMFGSRLLFRAYGVGRGMWPIDAALAGTDALVLLDEAHLSPALVALLSRLDACDAPNGGVLRAPGRSGRAAPEPLLPADRRHARLVALTATGRGHADFGLTETDLRHPVVRQRLDARKPTRLVETTARSLVSTLADEALRELDQRTGHGTPPAVCVFVNAPRTAREVYAAVRKKSRASGAFDVVMLTGQVRDVDADRIRQQLVDPASGAPAGSACGRVRALLVIATQTLEVGADLDFDVVVSESAGRRAIVQRWGRLNRLGLRDDAAGVLVHPTDLDRFGIYGTEPQRLWQSLCAQAQDGVLELGPACIDAIIGAPEDEPERVPELLPHHLWEFAKTTHPPSGHAPCELFFAGTEDETFRVAVAWRAVLPDPGEVVDPVPSEQEFVEVPVQEARHALGTREFRRISVDGARVEPRVDAADLRPGDRVLVLASDGGYRAETGWDPDSTECVRDLSPFVRQTVFLTPPALANLLGDAYDAEASALCEQAQPDPELGVDPALDAELGQRAATLLRRSLVELSEMQNPVLERLGEDQVPVLRWKMPGFRPEPFVDELDELSTTPRRTLVDHLASVGETAATLARAIGLPEVMIQVLYEAGRFHDLGKADPRFQRWLGAAGGGPLIAKSGMSRYRWRTAQMSSGWPTGARHELLSVQLLDAAVRAGFEVAEADLVYHLVISHHGKGRPWCPTTDGAGPVPTTVSVDGVTFSTETDPGRADWAQPDRFRALCERFGYWGLALLEAVVRQADHLVSRATPDSEVEVT